MIGRSVSGLLAVFALAVPLYAVTTHRFAKPGHYLVSAERTDQFGHRAVGHVHVEIRDSH